MTTIQLIQSIERAGDFEAVFGKENSLVKYKRALSLLHPDVCFINGATEAFIKLNELKMEFDKSKIFADDAGTFEREDKYVFFKGKSDLLEKSYNNYRILKDKRDESSLAFHKYIPDSMGISTQLQVGFKERTLPISRLVLPEHHVLWILSRMLEYCAWMSQIGYIHGGIHPESVFIVPEQHGVILSSFYHMTKVNTKLKTVSAKYQHWYPKETFKEKRARTKIDLEMTKRTAAYLLGDPSGMGIKLRKTNHPALIAFLIKQHKDAYNCYDEYRKMLKDNFEVKFHKLNL